MRSKSWPARPAALLVVAWLLVPGAAAAGDEIPPISPDRPDQTNGPDLVPQGTVQVELGATRAETAAGATDTAAEAWAQTLVRLGLAEACELRLAFDGWRAAATSAPAGHRSVHGTGDTSIGTKLRLVEEGRRRPAVSLLATVFLPTGSVALRRERATPQIVVALGHDLSSRLSLSANLGAEWDTLPEGTGVSDRSVVTGLASLSLALALGERQGAFVEIFGARTERNATGASFDAGLTFLLRPNLQLDFAAGLGLDGPVDDRFGTLGLSLRLPR